MATSQPLPEDVVFAVARQARPVNRTVDLGGIQVAVKHGDVAGWTDAQVTDSLARVFKAGGQDPALAGELRDRQLRLWLLYATNMLLGNREGAGAGFDVKRALVWLVENVRRVVPVMPSATGREFELLVLGRTGWLRAALKGKAARLTEGEREQVGGCYGVAGGGGARGQARALDAELLRAELLPKLYRHLGEHILQWRRPQDVPAKYQRLEDFRAIAELAQATAWERLQPFAAANENSPFFTGFTYFENVYDKTRAMPAEGDVVKHLMNRAHLIGGDASTGPSIFTRAGYDGGGVPEHRKLLWDMLGEWAGQNEKNRTLALFFCQHIGSNSHGDAEGGGIGLVTEFKADRPQSAHRWELVETIVHEMVHSLLHPDVKAKAGRVGRPLVVLEGFIEVVTREVFNAMVDNAGPDTVQRLMIGVEGELVAATRKTTLGYEENGRHADEVFRIVGRERFLTAFMTGDTALLALPV
ncbi:hypothetical protein ABGB17_23720 [Sphaerisporangium sp. B11E5]|uniref:hypothetical protein n=1 Tax=Sphaerisporangium sp. B11E5 TaxID=3153563 RepID=UPI00325D538C